MQLAMLQVLMLQTQLITQLHMLQTPNATNATAPHTMLATGNPILILLGVTAAIGGYAALRRRN